MRFAGSLGHIILFQPPVSYRVSGRALALPNIVFVATSSPHGFIL